MRPDDRFDELARRCGPPVVAYLARRCQPPDDAADVFQQVLTTTWLKLDRVPADEEAALCWMLAVARRHLANHQRGQRRRLLATQALARAISVEPAPPHDGPVSAAFESLAEDDQELLKLVYWEGLTLEQAASVIGVGPAAARKRAQRARDRMRQATGTHGLTRCGHPGHQQAR